MKKTVFLLLLFVLFIIVGFAIWHYILAPECFYQRNVLNEKSSAITANEIIRQFKSSDTALTQKFLNKTVSVTGRVSAAENNLDGNITVTLKSDDSTANVFCTLKSPAQKPAVGSTITVKGICTGLVLSDVVLNEAVIIK